VSARTRSGVVGRLLADARRGGPTLIGLALVVGLAGGVGALAFHGLLALATRLATGSSDYGVDGRQANPHLPWLGIWFVVVVPVIGGLIYGPLVARFAPEARGHGVPEVMLAVARGGGRIRPRVAAVKAIASATCIGTGRSARPSARPWGRCCGCPSATSGCSSDAARRPGSPAPSTPRSPERSSRWS
jgi:CIC family chloride channel protein